ncbi:MAG: hypothetical protein R3272_14740 [Candidatus Promineifilaceae bacterium]|nr:hypothetical protein [Candidatus Promineifilaceae bacterium]
MTQQTLLNSLAVRKLFSISLLGLLLALVLMGCSQLGGLEPAAEPEPTAEPQAMEEPETRVLDYEMLLNALQAADAPVEEVGALEGVDVQAPELFESATDAWDITIFDAPVSVFEFADEAAAQAAAETVNPTGTIIGNVTVDWVEPPHFYQAGRVIAVYAGEEQMVLDTLQMAMGEPFVVGQGGFGPVDAPAPEDEGQSEAPAGELDEMERYVDEVAAVAVGYPAGWHVIDVDEETKETSTAYAVTFQSWEPAAAGGGGRPEGGTKFDLAVMSGVPAGSLDEAAGWRDGQMADDPLTTVLSQERVTLGDDLEAVQWEVQSFGEIALVTLTVADGRVVIVSGVGDLALIEEITQTLERVR